MILGNLFEVGANSDNAYMELDLADEETLLQMSLQNNMGEK